MMGAAQIDQLGNENISCIGPWDRPKAQLLGVRGAPGNTVNHATSYWVPRHSPRVFVPGSTWSPGSATAGPPGSASAIRPTSTSSASW